MINGQPEQPTQEKLTVSLKLGLKVELAKGRAPEHNSKANYSKEVILFFSADQLQFSDPLSSKHCLQ